MRPEVTWYPTQLSLVPWVGPPHWKLRRAVARMTDCDCHSELRCYSNSSVIVVASSGNYRLNLGPRVLCEWIQDPGTHGLSDKDYGSSYKTVMMNSFTFKRR